MSAPGIPNFPRVHVLLREDGAGEVTIQGVSHLVHAATLEAARSFALGLVTMRAAHLLGRPVRVTATDPHGTWLLVVHPDGRVQVGDNTPLTTSHALPAGPIRLVSDSGETSAAGRSILVGRDPCPGPGESVDALLAVDDDQRLLSKTHARLDVAHDGTITLTDRGSTNGSRIELAGVSRTARPGEPMLVPLGAAIVVGGRRLTIAARGVS